MVMELSDLFGALMQVLILLVVVITPIVLWIRKRKFAALALGFVFVVIWIALAIPGLKRARGTPELVTCINNLIAIQDAKVEWVKQNDKQPSDIPAEGDLVGVGKRFTSLHKCPAGGTYAVNGYGANPTCSLNAEPHGHALAP